MLPLFTRDRDRAGFYVPTTSAASPWGPVTLHGGAPAGLMASVLEQHVAADRMQLVRFTVDLFRPVPMRPLEVRASRVRDGKRIQLLTASLYCDGEEISRATGLALQRTAIEVPAHARIEPGPPPPMRAALAVAPVTGVAGQSRSAVVRSSHGLHTLIGLKPVALDMGSGRGCAWVRLPLAVVEGRTNSPLVTVATVADFSNGFAQLHLSPQLGFINADISINLHRLPEGEWIGIDARTLAQDHGLALVETVLYDQRGAIGRVAQSSLTMARYQGE